MKIVQQICIGESNASKHDSTYYGLFARTHFNPGDYTGILHIYAEMSGYVNNALNTGYLSLWNYTTGEEICEIQYNEVAGTLKTSIDLKDILVSEADIGFRVKAEGSTGYVLFYYDNPAITVIQEDTQTTRKTVSCMSFKGFEYNYGSQTFSGSASKYIKPHIDSFDGEVSVYVEYVLYTVAGGIVEARLYDKTANTPVDGSNVTTDQTTPTIVASGEITLIADHEYYIQHRAQIAGKNASHCYSIFKIKSEGFNKIIGIPVSIVNAQKEEVFGYTDVGSLRISRKDLIDGNDGLVFQLNWYLSGYIEEAAELNWRWWNKTDSEMVESTLHTESISGAWSLFVEDTPVLPDSNDVLAIQYDFFEANGPERFMLYAYQQENLPSNEYLSPDKTKSSGYHCFISQFVKNLRAGFRPLKTPDGVNRCW